MTEHNYNRAIEILRSLQLNKVINDFMDTNKYRDIKQRIWYYIDLDLSNTQFTTMSELLRFMLAGKSQAPAQRKLSIAAPASSLSRPSTRTTPQNKHLVRDKSMKCRKFSAAIANMDSGWPARRLEYAASLLMHLKKRKQIAMLG